jgi:hypothetical protein
MKRYILLIAAIAFTYLQTNAQEMNEPLKKTFLAFDTTMDYATKVEQSNKLNMIAKKWNDEWASHYYNAYSKAQLSYMEKEEKKREAYLDEAEKELDEAISILGKENDETYVLAAMISNARMAIDPRNRWQKYGKIYEENLTKAKEINAENPRIYYLQGTSKFFTPKMFGGGKKAALPYFEKAAPLFAQESDADMKDPFWGRRANDYFILQCKGEDKD